MLYSRVGVQNIWSLIAQTSGSRFLWALSALVTAALTARFLGPAERGVFVVAIAWVTLFSTFGSLSLGWVAVHTAASRRDRDWIPAVAGSIVAIIGLVSLAGWALASSMYAGSSGALFRHLEPAVLALAFASLPLLLWIENGQGLLMASGKVPVMNIAQSTGAIAAVVLILVSLGLLGLRVRGALAAVFVANLITVTISLGHLIRTLPPLQVTRQVVRELVSGGAKLHLMTVGNFLINHASVVIMNHHRSSEETAYFQAGVQLVMGVQIVPIAIGAVAYSLVSASGPDAAWARHRRLLGQGILLSTTIAAVAYFVAPFAIPLLFGREFAPAVAVFRILLLAVPGASSGILMTPQWVGRGLFLQTGFVTVGIGAVTLLANWVVVPVHGMIGAAWVTVAGSLLALTAHIAMAVWVDTHVREMSGGAPV